MEDRMVYLFSYGFRGARWQIEVDADDEQEARERMDAMAEAKYDGVLVSRIEVPSGGQFNPGNGERH